MKNPIVLTPEATAAQALASAVEWANAAPGRKPAIAADLTALTGRPINRQMVEKWLHPDPTKRREPLIGIGLALIAVCTALAKGSADQFIRRHAAPGEPALFLSITVFAPTKTKSKSTK